MAFAIDNHDELMVLHRILMEAKFNENPNDLAIQGSPLVSNIANRIVEELIAMEAKDDGASAEKWNTWRKINPDRREYKLVEKKLHSELTWKSLNPAEQVQYVENMISPLQATSEIINTLLG